MASHRNQNILFLSGLSSLLLLVVLVLLNVAAGRMRVRVDLTEDKLFTLTEGTQRILENLGDPATIQVYWHNVPEQGEVHRRKIEDLLDEMESGSRGRLTVRWVDLDDEDEQRQAGEAGIEEDQFQATTDDQVTATRGYDSLLIEVGEEQQVVPRLIRFVYAGSNAGERISLLEYEVIQHLDKMTRTKDPVVGLVAATTPGNPYMRQGPTGRFQPFGDQILQPQFGKGYRSNIDLNEPVSPEVDVLLVAGPEELEETEVYHLEQFILRGGRTLVLLDPVQAAMGKAPEGEAKASGLEEWLAHLGVTVESGVVGDFRNHMSRPQQPDPRSRFNMFRYPYWPLLRATYLDQENPAITGFDAVPLYWPAPLALDVEKSEKAGRKAKILGTTSDWGYHRQDLIGLDMPAEFQSLTEQEIEEDRKVIPVMALLEGKMSSYWKGRPTPIEKAKAAAEAAEKKAAEAEAAAAEGASEAMPADLESDGDDAAEGADDVAGEDGAEEAAGPARLDDGEGLLVVLTDAEMITPVVIEVGQVAFRTALQSPDVYRGGLEFVQNIVGWMSGGEDLLEVRSKTTQPRRLEKKEPGEQKLITWANVAGVPLLILLSGMVVFLVRRVQR